MTDFPATKSPQVTYVDVKPYWESSSQAPLKSVHHCWFGPDSAADINPMHPLQPQLRTRLDASPRAEGCDIGGLADSHGS